jgi:hypothetical protein
MLIVALPITGLIGWALLAWRSRVDPALFRRTIAAAAPAYAAALLLLWQTRTGPAAQALAAPGAAALVWLLAPLAANARSSLVRIFGLAVVVIVGLGAAVPLIVGQLPPKKQTKRDIAINRANRLCNSMGGLRPIAQQPKGMVFSFVDYGPRLIAVTHHNAVTGPYHRNGEQIADVMKAFRGQPEQTRAILTKYRADYLLTCPMSSTTTIFMADAPNGFYAQLEKGRIPPWLQRIELPSDSPFKLWRVAR